MFFVYFIFIIACFSTIRGIIKAIKEKRMCGLLESILPFPFFFCFFVGFLSGGSALHNAENDYELYQAGHYYLTSHGIWTEVSYERYLFVLISEIIGFSTFAVFLYGHYFARKNKHKYGDTHLNKFQFAKQLTAAPIIRCCGCVLIMISCRSRRSGTSASARSSAGSGDLRRCTDRQRPAPPYHPDGSGNRSHRCRNP